MVSLTRAPSLRLHARFQLKIKVNECGNVITKPYKLNLYAQYNNEMCASVCHTFHSVCVSVNCVTFFD